MPTSHEVKQVFERAARENRVVKITYVSQYRGYPHRTTREVEPLAIHSAMVETYCRLRRDRRHFRYDRVEDIEITRTVFSRTSEHGDPTPQTPRVRVSSSHSSGRSGCVSIILLGVGVLVFTALSGGCVGGMAQLSESPVLPLDERLHAAQNHFGAGLEKSIVIVPKERSNRN
jgi:hypothetical protein